MLNLKDKVAVITGGAGIICSSMAKALASQGVKTAILDLNKEAAEKVAAEIKNEFNVASIGVSASVLDKNSLEAAREKIVSALGTPDILVNGAGGNSPAATTKWNGYRSQVPGIRKIPFLALSWKVLIRFSTLISRELSCLPWFSVRI